MVFNLLQKKLKKFYSKVKICQYNIQMNGAFSMEISAYNSLTNKIQNINLFQINFKKLYQINKLLKLKEFKINQFIITFLMKKKSLYLTKSNFSAQIFEDLELLRKNISGMELDKQILQQFSKELKKLLIYHTVK